MRERWDSHEHLSGRLCCCVGGGRGRLQRCLQSKGIVAGGGAIEMEVGRA